MRRLYWPAILTTLQIHARRRSTDAQGGQMETLTTLSTRGPPDTVRTRLPAEQSIPHLQHTLHDIGECDTVCLRAPLNIFGR
jgi:hypothetical protein